MSSVQTPTTAQFGVSALARRIGVRADTIRYYEKAGLLPAPQRSGADYRVYDESAVDRLQFIRGAQRLGLRLREIKTLLEVRDTGRCACEPAEDLLRQHIGEIDRELGRLQALRTNLVAMVDRLPGPDCPDPVPGTWRPSVPLAKGGEQKVEMYCDDPVCDGTCCGEGCC